MKQDSRLLGAWGEAQTAAFLRQKGYVIRAANYRTRQGEIDLIAEGHGMLVFVEVKTRRSTAFSRPREAVTPKKLARMRLAALAYLAETNCTLPARFDVAEVFAPEQLTQPPKAFHYLENVAEFDS